MNEVVSVVDVDAGDYVVYDNWVGQVSLPHSSHPLHAACIILIGISQVIEVKSYLSKHTYIEIDMTARCSTRPPSTWAWATWFAYPSSVHV